MSIQIPASHDLLANAFIQSAQALRFEKGLANYDIVIPKQLSDSLATLTVAKFGSSDHHINILAQHNPSYNLTELKTIVQNSANLCGVTVDKLKEWFSKTFKDAKDKLDSIAEQIINESKDTSIAIADYLEKMRQTIFTWVLRNSVLTSFDVGDGNAKKTFMPKKISTEGNFSIGSVDKGITAAIDIINFLKLIPTMGIKISVDYE